MLPLAHLSSIVRRLKCKSAIRIMTRKEVWKKECPGCREARRKSNAWARERNLPTIPVVGNYIPREYSLCDTCFMAKFNLEKTGGCHCCDPLGMSSHIREEDVLRLLRIICDGVSVEFKP